MKKLSILLIICLTCFVLRGKAETMTTLLTPRQESIASIAALTAAGNQEKGRPARRLNKGDVVRIPVDRNIGTVRHRTAGSHMFLWKQTGRRTKWIG